MYCAKNKGRSNMNYLLIDPDDKILIVAPHPDDECIGTGGLLASYSQQCNVLVLTDGRIGQSNYPPAKTIEIRKQELKEELDSIHVCYIAYSVEDGTLSKNHNVLDGFDLSKYTKIFVSGSNDGHPDHTAAYHIVKNAIMKQQVELELYLYEVHNPMTDPTHILDITDVIEKKIQLIQFHKSQLEDVLYDKMALALAKFRAIQNRRSNSYLEVYKLDMGNSLTKMNPLEIEIQKQKLFYMVLTKWIEASHKGWNIGRELKERGFACVCVYGAAELGKLAAFEINSELGIELKCIFDKKGEKEIASRNGFQILYPDRYYQDIDCIIVSAIYYFDEIKKELMKIGYDTILSLKEVVDNGG